MVSPTYLPSSNEGRRYPTRGAGPYPPPYQDRRTTAGLPSHELRSNAVSSSNKEAVDDSSAHRKRIAVACGRCRKRKIRCSGDDGTGQPCTNCKNASFEPCQFLRVSSQEAPMKGEGFPYTIDISSQIQAHDQAQANAHVRSQAHAHAHAQAQAQAQARGASLSGMLPNINTYMEGSTDNLTYRHGSIYGYASKQYYQQSGYPPGYTSHEPGAEYPMYPAYAAIQDPGYMMSYRIGPDSAAVKSNIYMDAEPDYGFSTGPAPPHPTSMLHRPSVLGTDSTHYPFQAVGIEATGIHNHGDRLTPPNSQRGSVSGSASYLYRGDGIQTAYSKHPQQASPSSTPSSTSPASDQAAYGTYETSAVASASSSSTYPLASPMRSQGDIYTTSSSSPGSMMPHTAASPQRSALGPVEMTYRYTDTTRQVVAPTSSIVMAGQQQSYMDQGQGHSDHSHGHSQYMEQSAHCTTTDDEALDGERRMSRSALRA